MTLTDAEQKVCTTLGLTEEEFVAESRFGVTPADYRAKVAARDLTPAELAAAHAAGMTNEDYAAAKLADAPPTEEETRATRVESLRRMAACSGSANQETAARLNGLADRILAGEDVSDEY